MLVVSLGLMYVFGIDGSCAGWSCHVEIVSSGCLYSLYFLGDKNGATCSAARPSNCSEKLWVGLMSPNHRESMVVGIEML